MCADTSTGPDRAQVLAALGRVRDPELDEPITDLGFVVEADVDGDGRVTVGLRLPTFFCAPNFAYLMAGDARREVAALPGVREVAVRLVDHFVDEEVSTGATEERGFGSTFEGLADGEDLEELRRTFTRKAYLARTHDVAELLLAAGVPRASLATTSLGDLPSGVEEVERFLARRSELGLPLAPESPVLLDVWGAVVPADEVDDHLRRARTVNVSIEGNAGFCRGLLETRYAAGGTGDDTGRIDPDVVREPVTRPLATKS
jgi:metal-sulfur cluster biosynthetic enzyme